MATIVLAAAGMALGGSVGGSVLGLSMATIGRAAGAAIGRSIDERLLGSGSAPVEVGRLDRFRLMGASEGTPVAQVHGRMRIAGQVIWASRFIESSATTGGGKGGPSRPRTTQFSYSVSLAIALCEGEITRVGRVWADGTEVARDDLNLRVYRGGEDQEPDPKMEAVEGAGRVPGYRGIAYVVLEDLELGQFGNRVPQFSFEVFRPAARSSDAEAGDLAHLVRGVAIIPGTGEYSLATTPVHLSRAFGEHVATNVHTIAGKTDFLVSLEALSEEMPQCRAASLVVSWFGDDLRAGRCSLRPKVEQAEVDGDEMPWRVSGLARGQAQVIRGSDGRPVYGGTPADASVVEAIRALRAQGQHVTFYPFILMEQLPGNGLRDPWTGAADQAPLPWRGRITLETAPGREGSPDGTVEAEAEVAAFFGVAGAEDFAVEDDAVAYVGPEDWSFRRFILHYAHLCRAAGGVEAFCIGSEMRGLTQIRGPGQTFPAVAALRVLAAEVRAILGPDCKIGYAADWSEYHGYQPPGTADKLFHLDPLWADASIDFIGIDNYMPLSDWRDGEAHLDAAAGAVHDLGYLTGNVAGGEGYDWFYHSPEARAAQIRTPITDGDGEPWVWRVKDLRGWWSNPHHDRVGGERAASPTAWQPRSKPIWFTEYGCAAIDKGTNQPNKFLDPKSSESALPHHSNGIRDDYVQMQYLRAVHRHYADPAANPVSEVYGGPMVDMDRAHVWAWDARPYPQFPANDAVWSDGGNYARGHWLNGRTSARSLASLVADICAGAGVPDVDVSRLHGIVRGFLIEDTGSARAALQPLMLAHAFDAIERDGTMVFASRTGIARSGIAEDAMALDPEMETTLEATRAAAAEISGRVRIGFVDIDGDYEQRSAEAVLADDASFAVSQSSLPLALTRAEGRRIAERWLAEARVARDGLRFALPPSQLGLGAGDVVRIGAAGQDGFYRIDRLEQGGFQAVEAVRVEPEVYRPHESEEDAVPPRPFLPAVPVEALFLDLPLLKGDEVPHAPHLAMTGLPWPGAVALYSAAQDSGYALSRIVETPAVVGVTEGPLFGAAPGLWDRGPALRVRLVRGTMRSVSEAEVLAGANVAAIGDGSPGNWEVFQFAEATLVAPRTYDLRLRLRGQAGSDGLMPPDWPQGSLVVLLDGVPAQIELAAGARDVERHYRFGPAARPLGDPSYRHRAAAFRGNGLRPYGVSHLRAAPVPDGTLVTWIRRTRIDGDSWSGLDVPLGEASESYLLRVLAGEAVLREVVIASPEWLYPAALRAADAAAGPLSVAVAQLSERFGPGPFRRIALG